MIILDVFLLLALVVFLVVGIFSGEYGNYVAGTATWLVGLCVLDLLLGVPVFSTIYDNPLLIAVYGIIYVGIGGLYSAFIRWPRYLNYHSEIIQSEHKKYAAKYPEGTLEDFMESSNYNDFKVSRNKDRLANWSLMWLFLAIWDLLNRPARFIYKRVYNAFGSLFTRIGKSVTKKIITKY